MKNILLSIGIAAALLAVFPAANAQSAPGLYSFMATGITLPAYSNNTYVVVGVSTNYWGAPGTTTNLLINVSTFDYAGLTFTGAGAGATTNVLLIYKSFDNGATFESSPTFGYTNTYASATVTTTTASLDVHGVTQLAITIGPGGAAAVTNAAIKLNLKSSLNYSTPPISFGTSPGKPIVVPSGQTTNGWAL